MSEQRKYTQDGVDYCWCTKHKEYSPCTGFTINRRTRHGYSYYCRQCTMNSKIDRTKFPRHKFVDGVEFCYCSQHKDYHPCEEFQLSSSKGYGYQYNCRVINQLIYTNRSNQFSSDFDKELSNMMLERMGYKTDGEISVHQQFKQKYQL